MTESLGTQFPSLRLTLFTYPSLHQRILSIPRLKLLIKLSIAALRFDRRRYRDLKIGGHPAVTRSLLNGLEKIGYPFNLNPRSIESVAQNVLVLSSITSLKEAIKLKEQGLIKQLWAGPNLVVLPTDKQAILSHPAIDKIIVPSSWVRDKYSKFSPQISSKLEVWPAGVDPCFWHPSFRSFCNLQGKEIQSAFNVLHYIKLSDPYSDASSLLPKATSALQRLGLNQQVLFYGRHHPNEYRKQLSSCNLLIYWTDRPESQGLALLEAWAMDVPTYVYEVNTAYFSNVAIVSSSCPLLTPECGCFFSSESSLLAAIKHMLHSPEPCYSPRRWVQSNMTDPLCAQRLLDILTLTKVTK